MHFTILTDKPISQEARLLKILKSAGSKGVANYDFPKARILRYSARIGDLRKQGYNIYCERQKLPNGRSTNVFRYYLIDNGEQ